MNKEEYSNYIKSEHWKSLSALVRGHYKKCMLCGDNRSRLHVHHNDYTRVGKEAFNDLIALCEDCHQLFHENKRVTSAKKENAQALGIRVNRIKKILDYLSLRVNRGSTETIDGASTFASSTVTERGVKHKLASGNYAEWIFHNLIWQSKGKRRGDSISFTSVKGDTKFSLGKHRAKNFDTNFPILCNEVFDPNVIKIEFNEEERETTVTFLQPPSFSRSICISDAVRLYYRNKGACLQSCSPVLTNLVLKSGNYSLIDAMRSYYSQFDYSFLDEFERFFEFDSNKYNPTKDYMRVDERHEKVIQKILVDIEKYFLARKKKINRSKLSEIKHHKELKDYVIETVYSDGDLALSEYFSLAYELLCAFEEGSDEYKYHIESVNELIREYYS